jgi:hypothetical protein
LSRSDGIDTAAVFRLESMNACRFSP